MYLQAVNPRRRQTLYVFQPADGIAHRANRHLLLVLVLNVFAVGRLEGFFPILPTGVRKPGVSADYWGEDFLFGCVRELPIEFKSQRQPVFAVQHGIPFWLRIRRGTRIADKTSIKFTIAWR